ncbi:DEAD/DEAH box helicase [Alicyclobacillus dauci]|uniref:DEAD/DEAH box helicase n=1 Tax=Alicyclobacillus dauci TaxID=1475485 RepID=A0ABY6ZBE0_9BACL|nr:DEAD/DEAH box helicase [Alicyclobacillus dauci]WAH39524.1 DEAD/DEAH box helicase [Alicyclobacillus dauci]WAH39584.1 DEAD/DEAH box helicase [Alicyclobacillus dauci]
MNITVTNELSIPLSDVPANVRQQIIDDLTLDNPPYQTALRMGYSTYGIEPTIQLYRAEAGSLYMPRGYIIRLRQLLDQSSTPYSVDDKRLWLPKVHMESSIELRPYQVPAVDALVRHQQGGVVAGCGSGKTICGLEAAVRTQQPILWLTHTEDLFRQVIERAVAVLDIKEDEIGRLGGGKWKVGERLTIGMVQTLAKRDLPDITDKFGCIVIDEAHRVPSDTFWRVVNEFPAAYRLWLSATPTRSDGLTDALFYGAGHIVHEVPRDAVPTVTPALVVIKTDYNTTYDNFSTQISNLIQNKARNQLIVDTIKQNAKGHFSLVLSDRLDHLKWLRSMLVNAIPDMTIEILHGKLNKRERVELLERIRNKQVDIVLATQVAREGLDIPHLDRLYLVCPKKAEGATEQEIGRIMRPCEGKNDAIVYDFLDIKNPRLQAQFNKRCAVYAKLKIRRMQTA